MVEEKIKYRMNWDRKGMVLNKLYNIVVIGEPRTITYKNKKSNMGESVDALDFLDKESGVEYTVWLNSKTLKSDVDELKSKGNLDGKELMFVKRSYTHPRFGANTLAFSLYEVKK